LSSLGGGNGQHWNPRGLAIGPNAHVFVADTWRHHVREFDDRGVFVRTGAGLAPATVGCRTRRR
jgi:hypothetical protein